jgi:16S rRNA (guanine527-N7)-methyltransferase
LTPTGSGPAFPDRPTELELPPDELLDDLVARLDPLTAMAAEAPASLTSVTDPEAAENVHLRDSLSALALAPVDRARSVVDIGSGAGYPGIPLAMALPEANFLLLDSVGKKARFAGEAASRLGLGNVEAVAARSEEIAAGECREGFDLALARAVAPLSVLAELASPLLAEGGTLVAWKGEREVAEEARVGALATRLALEPAGLFSVVPFEGSRPRHLYVLWKTGPTPEGLPRRPGMARKRPLSE